MIPIHNYRTCIGHAKTVAGAKRLLRKMLTVDSRMKIDVWQRSKNICETCHLPGGFVYSISYN